MSPLLWILLVVFGGPTALGILYGVIRILCFPIWLAVQARRRHVG